MRVTQSGIVLLNGAVSRIYGFDDRMINESGAVGGMRICGGDQKYSEKTRPVPLFHHKSHMIQPGNESRAAAMRSRRLALFLDFLCLL
jgi:hypothetical protein